tara:strand:- start:1002 stop:1751 length:750 start_codon:yes stop_codon:yes gene_type:complete
MGYQQKSHQNGIKNEKFMCEFLTEVNHYGCEVRHKGGTKVVEDGDTENGDKSSFKRWKGATHDWYNSSPLGRDIGLYNLIKPFIEQFKKDIENVPVGDHYTYRKEQEKELNKLIANSLDEFCTQEVADKVIDNFISHTKDMDVVVNEVNANKIHIYKFDEHPAVVYYNKGYKPVIVSKSGKKKCSRSIFMEKDGDRVDIGLRIRFTTNNGLKPFTKEGSPNKSTISVIKLQQDDVDKILAKVPTVCYNY